jgi:hypothetical protein
MPPGCSCLVATAKALQWGFSLVSAPSMIGPVSSVCEALCGYDECWFPYVWRAPFYMPLRERGPTATRTAVAPD